MSQENATEAVESISVPSVRVEKPTIKLDLSTILGLLLAFGFIGGAIMIGDSNASFFNVPSLMIVLFGTMAATAVSFTGDEIMKSGSVFAKSMRRRIMSPKKLASTLIDLAVIAKKKGILALATYDTELRKEKFLERSLQLVIDGYNADEIEHVLIQEIDTLTERHKRTATMAQRAAEVAPAMGLIGTLVGLVQMLADLENPESIGPAMAVALLTTFYGAILGTVVMAPLAVKLEKNSKDEALIKTLIKTAAVSISRQDNPRRLEMMLNSELPPAERIRYFD